MGSILNLRPARLPQSPQQLTSTFSVTASFYKHGRRSGTHQSRHALCLVRGFAISTQSPRCRHISNCPAKGRHFNRAKAEKAKGPGKPSPFADRDNPDPLLSKGTLPKCHYLMLTYYNTLLPRKCHLSAILTPS